MTPLRFITAASLFDGHDVSINIIRRILQSKGVEVIHLGHNRSAMDVVKAAIEEDADAVALSSYQGGHNEYFLYIRKLLNDFNAKNIQIFGGGGGVITAAEIKHLEEQGVNKIYTPEDGVQLGLEGIIDDMIKRVKSSQSNKAPVLDFRKNQLTKLEIAKAITQIELNGVDVELKGITNKAPVLGITGTGGAGKSSLIDELLTRFRIHMPELKIALVSVDPTKKKSAGALLGDRIRLNNADYPEYYIRSLATRGSGTALSPHIGKVINFLKQLDFELVIVESSGIGQASDEIKEVSDKSIYVMTSEYGASTQLEKIEMIDVADFIAINKFDRPRSEDALRDVRKQFKRSRKIFNKSVDPNQDEQLPIFGTIAAKFNDEGVSALFQSLVSALLPKYSDRINFSYKSKSITSLQKLIPPERANYLNEIAQVCKNYNEQTSKIVSDLDLYQTLVDAKKVLKSPEIEAEISILSKRIPQNVFEEIEKLNSTVESYSKGKVEYNSKNKSTSYETKYKSLSGNIIPVVALPKLKRFSDKFKFIRDQNIPGYFPFACGIFPFKRKDEQPKRMFAGEGGPKRTNKRFHFLCEGEEFKRLSTAFDSVTLYGEDPDLRPDIYGKIGESGVSICTLDDMDDLYRDFKLSDPKTSVSMTINGPAPILLAMFVNTAAKQVLSNSDLEKKDKIIEVMKQVRGTVQADILKEDQAQNTCIFSLDFALKLMGDVQEFYSKNNIKNYYTVSISGYHIAEAGANPITQLAFTLANGFTYVESYLNRGLKIDDFCENLSFFFSNGLDPEYSVMGRVARKIWAVALREKYGASLKSQKLKYHVQTSGRSLHAQEIDFNDIRTTLQAFLALSDNCNSLHTNAYDEAVTTPTEDSVRRAMAIQLIINKEFGPTYTENFLQGSYIIDELADIVEKAVLEEFVKISERGGVLGAMESMYQRNKIQEESLYYETLKDQGIVQIVGVNCYKNEKSNHDSLEGLKLSRSTIDEKNDQIERLNRFKKKNSKTSEQMLKKLKEVALNGGNIFEELLHTVRHCTLGQITQALFEVGGRYRRSV